MVSLGLTRALHLRGRAVRAFKKGPDYIDAAWLSLASKAPQGNLDPFFTPGQTLLNLFSDMAAGYDLALVEGNRGLFDGLDLDGSCSTAEVSRILRAPLILVLDCTKMTRTVAALVKGCLTFEQGLNIGGVILNRTGNPRHQSLLRAAVEELNGVPVLGVLPRSKATLIPERHMGLVGREECAQADAFLDSIAAFISDHVDLEAVERLADSAPDLPATENEPLRPDTTCLAIDAGQTVPMSAMTEPPVIGYVQDAAFWFYYQENLDALRREGARLVPVSLLDPAPWPTLDGLYIGGGVPELYAAPLSANREKLALIKSLALSGLPIYAECGGFMYLSRSLMYKGKRYPMAGVFPCAVEFHDKPQGLGYIAGEVAAPNPYHPQGLSFRGHEFHFSQCIISESLSVQPYIFRLSRGRGMTRAEQGPGCDGLMLEQTFASYTHIYAPALPDWAPAFVSLCLEQRRS